MALTVGIGIRIGKEKQKGSALPDGYLIEEDSENYLIEEDSINILTEE